MLQNVFTLQTWVKVFEQTLYTRQLCLFSCQVSDIASHHKKIIFIWWLELDFMAIYLLFSFPDWDISYIYNIDICFSASYLWHSFSHLCMCSLDLSLLFAWRSLCIPHSYKSETMDTQFSQILVDTLHKSRTFFNWNLNFSILANDNIASNPFHYKIMIGWDMFSEIKLRS